MDNDIRCTHCQSQLNEKQEEFKLDGDVMCEPCYRTAQDLLEMFKDEFVTAERTKIVHAMARLTPAEFLRRMKL